MKKRKGAKNAPKAPAAGAGAPNKNALTSSWTMSRAGEDGGYCELLGTGNTIVDWPHDLVPPEALPGSTLSFSVLIVKGPESTTDYTASFGAGRLGLGMDQVSKTLLNTDCDPMLPLYTCAMPCVSMC